MYWFVYWGPIVLMIPHGPHKFTIQSGLGSFNLLEASIAQEEHVHTVHIHHGGYELISFKTVRCTFVQIFASRGIRNL